MTTAPRYSIIPAGAVIDPRLMGRDLQVLGYLGTHTNKLGWCFLSQGTIADKLNCGRSTVQRSLSRLVDAGWVQIKAGGVVNGQPHACHAYRVIMDRDDPELGPSKYEVEDQMRDRGCPPVGTEVPAQIGQGCPAMAGQGVPTHARAHNDPDSGGSGGGARARGSLISEEAHQTAEQLATIAGHDPLFLPVRWMSDGPAMRVQMMLDHGWRPEMMIETSRAIMARKNDGPPQTIRYFERPFARAHALQSKPLPLEQSDVQANSSSSSRFDRKQRSRSQGFAGLSARLRSGQSAGSG